MTPLPTRVLAKSPELDRRCEALAAIIKDLRPIAPVHFREIREGNYWQLYTRCVK
jgi:hypothetical protein